MRDRLLATVVVLTLVIIGLYGVPRAYFLADMVQTTEEHELQRSVELFSLVLSAREGAPEPVTEEFLSGLLAEGEGIEYVAADGRVLRAGESHDGPDDLVDTLELSDGGRITLGRSSDVITERVSDALLPLVLLGMALLVLAAGTGVYLARRFSRPFDELASAADRLGRGQFDLDVPHYPIPEAEAIGQALRQSSIRLKGLVQRERDFAANASHQLRTPITALRLSLEDLSMWPETPPDVAAELTESLSELDRLGHAITEILELSRGGRLGDAIDLDLRALVADVVERWRPHAEENGHEIEGVTGDALPVRVIPGPVAQVLDVLIHNACSHGQGTISLECHDKDHYVTVVVGDEGPRTIGSEVFGRGAGSGGAGLGLGLTIASELVTSMGGYLTLSDAPTTTFVLTLPKNVDDRPH